MSWKNWVIAVSVVLNAALLAYLLLGTAPTVFVTPAYGQNRISSGGGFTITTGNITSGRKAMWVIDSTDKRMIVYAFPAARGQNMEIIAERDLRKDFGENLAGDLLITQGDITGGTEAVYIVDTVGKRLIAYNCRGTGKEVEVIGQRDLGKDFRK